MSVTSMKGSRYVAGRSCVAVGVGAGQASLYAGFERYDAAAVVAEPHWAPMSSDLSANVPR